MMAAVAAMMSTITMAITPPMMATVLSVLETELAGSEGAAVCGGGVVVVEALFLGPTAAVKKFVESDRLMHGKFGHKNCAIK